MKLEKYPIPLMILLIVLECLIPSITAATQRSQTIAASGNITTASQVNITINASKAISVNSLSIGVQIDGEWKEWLDRPVLKEVTQNASFKLIRVFDFRKTTPKLGPCTNWNEAAKTGTFDWTYIDQLTRKIFEIGAEPLFCLGWARDNIQNYIPTGMAIDPNTALPYPDSWAVYCREWIKHFKSIGLPVRFYETTNEPWTYFGWVDYTKLANFKTLFNTAAVAMRSENPNILISFDGTNRKYVLDYWLANGGADLGFIAFHKYDAYALGQYSDELLLSRAESSQLVTSSDYYGVQDAKQKYFNARGKWIPVINSESNLNSACDAGTDPRIQQIVGAAWLALTMRTCILSTLDYSVYYHFASSKSWQESIGLGWGFGMTNLDDNKPWYPYFVNRMIGNNLSPGDSIVESNSDSADMRVLAWKHGSSTNVLLISKVRDVKNIAINGLNRQQNITLIDETFLFTQPTVQSKMLGIGESFQTRGYAVVLLQS